MTRPTSKRLLAAGTLALAAGLIGARSARAMAGATPHHLLASVGVAPHDDGDDGGDGGDGDDSGDDTGSDQGR